MYDDTRTCILFGKKRKKRYFLNMWTWLGGIVRHLFYLHHRPTPIYIAVPENRRHQTPNTNTIQPLERPLNEWRVTIGIVVEGEDIEGRMSRGCLRGPEDITIHSWYLNPLWMRITRQWLNWREVVKNNWVFYSLLCSLFVHAFCSLCVYVWSLLIVVLLLSSVFCSVVFMDNMWQRRNKTQQQQQTSRIKLVRYASCIHSFKSTEGGNENSFGIWSLLFYSWWLGERGLRPGWVWPTTAQMVISKICFSSYFFMYELINLSFEA